MEHLLMLAILKLKEIAEKLGLIADYVVEQGTIDIWKYEKWNSGKCILKAYSTLSGVTATNSYGASYRSQVFSYSIPNGLIKTVNNAFTAGNLGGTWGGISYASTTVVGLFLISPTPLGALSSDYFWCVTVEGTWK